MGTIGKSVNSPLGTKIFEFSIDGSDKKLLEELKESLGQSVNLDFEQKYMVFPWQGGTKFFATSVKSSGKIIKEKKTGLPQLDN